MSLLEVQKQRFLNELPINQQLPQSLPNGAKISEFIGECSTCMRELPNEHLRGVVSKPYQNIINLDAIGFCQGCQTIFPLNARMKVFNKKTFLEYTMNGQWVRVPFERGSATDRTATAIKHWWKVLKDAVHIMRL